MGRHSRHYRCVGVGDDSVWPNRIKIILEDSLFFLKFLLHIIQVSNNGSKEKVATTSSQLAPTP
jgi:hypothetical protein